MRDSLLQIMVLIKWKSRWVSAGGRFLLPVQGTQPEAVIAECNLRSPHTLLFLGMRQRGAASGSSGFLHFGPIIHLTCWFFPFYFKCCFFDHSVFLFPLAHPSFNVAKTSNWSSFSPRCLFVQSEKALLQTDSQSRILSCGTWKHSESLWFRDRKYL